MNNPEEKPDPDLILKAILEEEKFEKQGKLKIFFGMSAGVGKTYAMLKDAQQRLREGANVMVGTINTHGRKETQEILQGLPIVPEKWVKYKDTVFEELDLDKILELKPSLILIDELAHTNVPGSKHPKRWQDVLEILDAGINVYTTLNVQHLESRKDIVEGLTGIQIRETVPDVVLERATSIELIDIPPAELLQRLKEGKVYLGDQSQIAARNFFKVDHLTALREIALRFTAEKVDHDLHSMLVQGKSWKTRERLMVGVSPAPSSQVLIRTARRLAFQLDAPWIAVYVDTGKVLTDQEQTQLTQSLNLARDLGAEVIATNDIDIATALQRVAKQKDITRIIVGRTTENSNFFNRFWKDSFIERLEKENKHIDLLILHQDPMTHIFQKSFPRFHMESRFVDYLIVIGVVLGINLLGYFTQNLFGHQLIGLFYLLGIIALNFLTGIGPLLLSAGLSALSWIFLFIPQHYANIKEAYFDFGLIIFYFFTAFLLGILTSYFRKKEHNLKLREAKMENLYEVEREIANATSLETLRQNVSARLTPIFPGTFEILIKSFDNQLIFDRSLPQLNQEKEKAAVAWVFNQGKMGGRFTNTLPSSEGIYFPIKFSNNCIGVLCYFPARQRPLSIDEINFIQTITQQLGIFLERHLFEDRLRRQEYSRQVEKLHHSIFHSLNRSLYEPIGEILAIHQQIKGLHKDLKIAPLLDKMENYLHSFRFVIDNVVTISELESGFIHFQKKKSNIQKVIEESLKDVRPFVKEHPIDIDIPSNPPLLSFDFDLLKQAINNLIINACEYSESHRPVRILVEMQENTFRLSFIDCGKGIPEDLLPNIFEKFYRLPDTSAKGLGLGLSIVKSVVDLHQGSIIVTSRPEGGTIITLTLPSKS